MRIRRSTQLLLASLLAAFSPTVAAARTKLAVMDIVDQTRTVEAGVLESLTDALRTQLAQGGEFIVIDKSRQAAALKKLVAEQKKESYRSCYDNRCQIPLGQALAADSILRTKLGKVGSYYVLNAELVDLEKEAVTNAAQARVVFAPRQRRDDRLLGAVSSVAQQLGGKSSAPPRGDVPVRVVPPPPVDAPPTPYERTFTSPSERRDETPEQLRERVERTRAFREAQERQRQQQAATSGQLAVQQERARRRSTYLIYGWMGIITGGIIAGSGVYYMTAKANEGRDRAAQATSASVLDTAADEAKKARTTGIVITALGGVTVGLGALLVIAAPRALERPLNVAGVKLQRLPTGGPTPGGFALGWGGKF